MGWNRHTLFVFIAHLFISKLRRLISIDVDTPDAALFANNPVTIKDRWESLG
jgi:hypothetical protein